MGRLMLTSIKTRLPKGLSLLEGGGNEQLERQLYRERKGCEMREEVSGRQPEVALLD